MASVIRWLHLSDFHVGKDDYGTRKMFDYIIGHVKHRKNAPDLVFITGDLANRGLASEYETFWMEFAWPLQDQIGGTVADRTFAIPGNHDVDRTKYSAFDRDEMCSAASKYFDPTKEGREKREEMLLPRFKAFVDSDGTVAKGSFNTEAGTFTRVVEIGGKKVGIAGINTAWVCKDDKDREKLTPGKPLLEQALDSLEGTHLRIVLGHHPIDWLLPREQKAVKSVLGKHSVLYLHGHLHEAWAEPAYGSGHQFLTVQSGAAFQAREGEIWRNGLVWGEADLDAQTVRLQPWRWNPDHQNWSLAADAFPEVHRQGEWWEYGLPGTAATERMANAASAPPAPPPPPPKGWSVTTSEELTAHLQTLPEDAAVRFFNGAVPGWHTALSTSIPRRQIVQAVARHFDDAQTAARPIVTLLLAPACEGKTTALLQAAYEVVRDKPEWRILRRSDDAEPLNPADILPVLSETRRWLLVVDEADRAAGGILSLIQQSPPELHGRVHFLIACRDSDWHASGAQARNWASVSAFRLERVAGLVKEDAEAIVKAWAAFSKAGLGDLAAVPAEQRAEALDRQVHEEAKTSKGAFFGALLAVRHGSDLSNHARLMLERLGQRPIPTGGTLRDAIAYIAAMHAEGLEFLSRPVLAQVLGCPLSKLHRTVIAPLGAEAAATTTSSFVFTRHRRVAETLVSVLSDDMGEDIAGGYVRLAEAAIQAAQAGEFVPPNVSVWRYDLAEHFFQNGQTELALRVAKGVLSREPQDDMTLVKVANLHRRAGATHEAVSLLRQSVRGSRVNRSFFYEWAVCEGEIGNQAAAALLAAFSVSDSCGPAQVDNDSAKRILAGLGVAFRELFSAHHDVAFRDARAAVATLGLQLRLDDTAREYFQRHTEEAMAAGAGVPMPPEALAALRRGILSAEGTGVQPDAALVVPDVSGLEFEGLRKLIDDAAAMKKR